MEFKQLEIELEAYSIKLKEELIKKLKSKGHYETGHLEKSITIKFKKEMDKYQLEISGLEYLEFLEDGKFLKDFLKEHDKEMETKIADAIAKDILNFLD